MSDWYLPPFEVDAVMTAAGQQMDWSVKLLGIPDLWKKTQGDGIRVAVLDTGSGREHPDLMDAIVAEKDFTGSRHGPRDINGHGTHCAGIIAARDNETGVVGIAPKALILSGKVLGDNGSGSGQSVAAGLQWAIDERADVISMSLGSPQPDQQILAAIQRATAEGIFVICAAGNSGPAPNSVDYPGRWKDVVCVAAMNRERKISRFSSRGPEVDIAFPGEKILSTYLNGGVAVLSGTSMATPGVAGCVALMLAVNKSIVGNAKLLEKLKSAAIDIDAPGQDTASGFGLVDPAKLVEDAAVVIPPPGTGANVLVIGSGDTVEIRVKRAAG